MLHEHSIYNPYNFFSANRFSTSFSRSSKPSFSLCRIKIDLTIYFQPSFQLAQMFLGCCAVVGLLLGLGAVMVRRKQRKSHYA